MAETGKDRLARLESLTKELPEAWQVEVTWLITVVRKLAREVQAIRGSAPQKIPEQRNDWDRWQDCTMKFGKHKGQTLEEIAERYPDYLLWLWEHLVFKSERFKQAMREALKWIEETTVEAEPEETEEEQAAQTVPQEEEMPAPPATGEDIRF